MNAPPLAVAQFDRGSYGILRDSRQPDPEARNCLDQQYSAEDQALGIVNRLGRCSLLLLSEEYAPRITAEI
jgi:hypothetical protein